MLDRRGRTDQMQDDKMGEKRGVKRRGVVRRWGQRAVIKSLHTQLQEFGMLETAEGRHGAQGAEETWGNCWIPAGLGGRFLVGWLPGELGEPLFPQALPWSNRDSVSADQRQAPRFPSNQGGQAASGPREAL